MKTYVEQTLQKIDEQFAAIMQSGGKIPIYYEDALGNGTKIIAHSKKGDERGILLRGEREFRKLNIGTDKLYITD